MSEYISRFLKKYNYPQESFEEILSTALIIENDIDFIHLIDSFYVDINLNAEAIATLLEQISKSKNINLYTLNLLFYIFWLKKMKEQYKKKGIEEKIYHETIEDLKYKTIECKNKNDIWGLGTIEWTYYIFHLRTFKLGRLEYNVGEYYGDDSYIRGIKIKKGDSVIFIHIPSSGEPFDKNSRFEAYNRAYHFYKQFFNIKEPVFCCSSWLLFEPNKEILEKKGIFLEEV